jgi:TatA/E family protein of Tat protein translocase
MGSLGWQETLAIFILALILFGPKKLPELGRTLGKAITEFRRASSELRSSFDREMKNLEQETAPIKQAASEYPYEPYNYDYSSGSHYDHSAGAEGSEFTASHPQLTSASAPEGAELTTSSASPEGTVAYGTGTEAVNGSSGQTAIVETAAVPEGTPHEAASAELPAPVSTTAEHPVSTTTEHKA